MAEIDKRVGANLKAARERARLTQEELADAFGCTQETLSSWETGRRPISLEKLDGIAKHLGTSVGHLLGVEAPLADWQSLRQAIIDQKDEFVGEIKALGDYLKARDREHQEIMIGVRDAMAGLAKLLRESGVLDTGADKGKRAG